MPLRVAAAKLLVQERVNAGDFTFADLGSSSTRTVVPAHRRVRATLQLKF